MFRICIDSSANLAALEGVDYVSVPMKIIAGEREFIDTPEQDVEEMQAELLTCKTKTGTACPSVGDWLAAFGDAEYVLCAALTSKISGCYNAAKIAAEQYMDEYPGRQVFVLDSLTTGPELELIAEKYRDLIAMGLDFEMICEKIEGYLSRTHLAFQLSSLQNFARNGRVNPALAKLVEVMNIRIVGRASAGGELEPLNKIRGEGKALEQIMKNMLAEGYNGGRVRIRHTGCLPTAEAMKRILLAQFPDADVAIGENRVLCAYYAERSGMLVGFEGTVTV